MGVRGVCLRHGNVVAAAALVPTAEATVVRQGRGEKYGVAADGSNALAHGLVGVGGAGRNHHVATDIPTRHR